MSTPANRLYSGWQNFGIFAGMLMFAIAGAGFSILLPESIAAKAWRLVLQAFGVISSVGIFGLLAIRALRIGLYVETPTNLTVRSLGITRTISLNAILGTALYHGHSAHGGRFYAPAIRVRMNGDQTRVVRLWWLASVAEENGKKWEADVISIIGDAHAMAARPR